MRRSPDIVVIGSGLAGMTAAVYLSEAGHKVCVLEANPFIGGRTASWIDKGMAIESGFHRFLGFYTALPEVLSKVGIDLDEMLCWEDEIEIRLPGGDAAVFGLAPLHKPAKTIAAALGNNDFLSPADKASAVRMFAAGAKDYVARPEELDSVAVLDYARDHGVTKQAVERLLTPLTEGIFFMPVDRYSMYNLMGLFMPYLKSMYKLRVGAFTGGMTEVMMQPMADYVVARGGEIHTNAPVDRLYIKKDEVCGAFAAGKKFCAKRVVLAASLAGAQKILKRK